MYLTGTSWFVLPESAGATTDEEMGYVVSVEIWSGVDQ